MPDDKTRVKATPALDATVINPRTAEQPVPVPLADKTVLQSDRAQAQETRVAPAKLTTPGDARLLCAGDTIKQRFVLDKLLGTGGMGAVYRALDLRKQEANDDRPYIAIKVLGEEFKRHPQALITLQREAKKTQDLAHPNIVTVYDFDRDGDLVYLTMEELKGNSLEDLLAQDKYLPTLDKKQKLNIIREIALGLSYAHSKGIVHSDLKPGNVFITDAGTVKLLDFGIARAANEKLYQDNFDAGALGAITFSYASPEMVRHEAPHPSDDIYALGVIACELLGGEHPFDRQDAQNALEQRLSPKLPKLKNPLLSKLLASSIAFTREQRIADANTFLKKLAFATTAPTRSAILLATIVLAIVGNYFYLQQVAAVPFSDLPPAAQEKFHALIKESETALSFGDMQGAVFNIDQAYQIHGDNDELDALTQQVGEIMEKNIRAAKTDQERAFYNNQLQQLKTYPAFSNLEIDTE